MWGMLLSAATGAALMYFLDPDRGRRRRNMARDRAVATFRHGARSAERLGRRATGDAQGLAHRVTHARSAGTEALDDVTLARKVESELFRGRDIPRGRINVNVQEGVLVLRGELDRPEQIAELEAAARKIPGIREVQNLLHVAGTPAPQAGTAPATDQVIAMGHAGSHPAQ